MRGNLIYWAVLEGDSEFCILKYCEKLKSSVLNQLQLSFTITLLNEGPL